MKQLPESKPTLRKPFFFLLSLLVAGGCAGTPPAKTMRYPTRAQEANVYVVEKGETLNDVAKKFDVKPESLKSANNLTKDSIIEGQRLRIPPASNGSFLAPSPPGEKTEKPERQERGKQEKAEKQRPPKVKALPPPVAAPRISTALHWPVEGSIISPFGIRKNGKHDGVDISAGEGSKILAAAGGTVIFSGWGPAGYGNIVVIKHSDSLVTVYAHNQKNLVERGAQVKTGEDVALVGHTGRATTPHCHFEVRVNRVAYDPLEYLPKR